MSKADELAKQLFSGIKETAQAIAPGLKDLGPEIGAEMKRMGAQGASELAHALFSGSAYVPYGTGQQPAKEQEHQQERGGRE